MMKTKANIKRNRANQEFEFSVCLKGNAETIKQLERILSGINHFDGLPKRKMRWDPWRTAYLLLLGVFLWNLPRYM